MYYVYIIYSQKLKSKYIGYSDNIKRRVVEHQNGKSRYTKKTDDWQLVYYEGFINKSDARIEEIFLKSGKGQERIKYLLKNYFI
ncbi:hypothetical protein A2V71_03800 [Candidatus Berkelbacteria bacterium RBG_13_40_8]|uniref:GIY-YIG domain-containing protein n=1 Tax=Candidatus Berkelbacteria bacterium RBG_13_40_8 TaxID=1797467 RepID=A0A1F5DLV6_9BACT|nr:MAG: hypothetical protein A2V71_03800 [Candidatus Berkelbacteria bacterium RBG_13_40_8]